MEALGGISVAERHGVEEGGAAVVVGGVHLRPTQHHLQAATGQTTWQKSDFL